MDKLFFRNLKLSASVGIFPHEKAQSQTLLINLEFVIDASTVKTLADTIDYAKVRSRILEIINTKHYDLLETLSEIIAQQLKKEFQMQWLKLSIKKPDIFSDMEAVGIVIER